MQPFQYDLRSSAAKDNSITHAAAAPSNLDAAIPMRSAVTQLQNTKEVGKRHCSTRASVWKSRCSGQNVPVLDGSWPAQCHASFHVQKCSVMVTSSPPCMFRSPTSKWPSTCKACKVLMLTSALPSVAAGPPGWLSNAPSQSQARHHCHAAAPAPPTSDGATQVPGGTPTCAACEWWQSLAACKHRRLRHWHSLVPWPWQLRTHGCEQSATNLQRTTAWLPVSTKYHTCKVCLGNLRLGSSLACSASQKSHAPLRSWHLHWNLHQAVPDSLVALRHTRPAPPHQHHCVDRAYYICLSASDTTYGEHAAQADNCLSWAIASGQLKFGTGAIGDPSSTRSVRPTVWSPGQGRRKLELHNRISTPKQ